MTPTTITRKLMRRTALEDALRGSADPNYQVAYELGFHESLMTRFVRGDRAPTEEMAKRIADRLGYTPEALFPDMYETAAAQ